MRNLSSIFPDGTLIEIRTPERPNFNHRDGVQGGNMRNSK